MLLTLLIGILVLALISWLVNYVPLENGFRRLIWAVVIVLFFYWLIQLLLGHPVNL